jgi:hypothetical protein
MSPSIVRPNFLIFFAILYFISAFSLAMASEQGDSAAKKEQENAVGWAIRLPKEEQVIFKGEIGKQEGGTGPTHMTYPAPNLGGLIAAVITHGTLVAVGKNHQNDKLQQQADKALAPYKGMLESYQSRDLVQQAITRLTFSGDKEIVQFQDEVNGKWVIENLPVFTISRNQTAIILDNEIKVYSSDSSEKEIFHNVVRVISTPRSAEKSGEKWISDEAALKAETAFLFAQSLDVAVENAKSNNQSKNLPLTTVRYVEGDTEKMERAQVLSNRCNRVLLKTLRGILMSAPVNPSTAVNECSSPAGTLASQSTTQN